MQAVSAPPVAKAIQLYETRTGLKIKIDKDFYQKVDINSKRFGLLLKGRLEPSFDEVRRVVAALNISLTDLL
ncbi:hypothetical protein [uncultured Spirosoma sp.]|uniref:hypothetical protein n=1 Tax=uncultured Spirosoma sp. TaxID=278208 RepID=UPI002587BBEB|nr:hypothetical protein [uncultured Spirosoma sp.]